MNIINKKILQSSFFLLFSVNIFANIASSINPVGSIIKEIVGDKHKVNTIAPVSPHITQLKPSQIKILKEAEIIFYIDDDLEVFIQKFMHNLTNKKVVNIADNINIKLLDLDHSGEHAENENEHEDEHHHEHKKNEDSHNHESHKEDGHNHESHKEDSHNNKSHKEDGHNHSGNKDLHIWLDPKISIKIANLVTDELIKIYPENKNLYKKNNYIFKQKIKSLNDDLINKFNKDSDKKIIIFHNAYRYFLNSYNINNAVLASIENSNMSIKKLLELKKIMAENNVSCVLTDQDYHKKSINNLIVGTDIKHQIVKPINDINTNYFTLITNVANQFESCL